MQLHQSNLMFRQCSVNDVRAVFEAGLASEFKCLGKGDGGLAALCVFLAAACSFDYRDRRVPNGLILLMAAVGMAWRFWGGGPWGAVSYAGKAALLMALLYPFFKIASVGAGDVKLLGVTAG